MQVLIADAFVEDGVKELKRVCGEQNVRADASLKGDLLKPAMPGVQVLVVRSTKVPKEVIEAGDELSLIVRAGAGVENIDTAAASERGIYVANCPGKNSIAVAELAMGLILALDRRIPDNVADLRTGKWNKKEYSKADGLAGKTLGIVGMGHIGQALAERAKAFGLKVVGWSRSLTLEKAEQLGVGYARDLITLAKQSDILSLHISGGKDTEHLINEFILKALPKGAMLINTARASVVDHDALRKAITERGLRVAMDVFPEEPGANDKEFKGDWASLPGVIGTHHIGASTEQAQQAIAEEAVRVIRHFKETGEVLNVVNLCKRSPAVAQLIVRHYDRVGVLADVLDIIKEAGINVQDMSNVIFDGAKAACAKVNLDVPPGADVLDKIRKSDDAIIHVELVTLGKGGK